MPVFQFFAKLISILISLGLPIWQWISAHQAQIAKAVADLEAGAPLTQVIADLLAATGLAGKRALAPATCADACKGVCDGAAKAILAIHADDAEGTMAALTTALVAASPCCTL